MFFLTPLPLFADFSLSTGGMTFKGVVEEATNLIYLVIPILYVLCFIAFFWGLTKFLINAGNKDELKTGRQYMIWGAVVLFVLVSVRSILGIVSNEFFGKNDIVKPLLPGSNQTTPDNRFIDNTGGIVPQIKIK